jgi:hypothetical protein
LSQSATAILNLLGSLPRHCMHHSHLFATKFYDRLAKTHVEWLDSLVHNSCLRCPQRSPPAQNWVWVQ